MSATIMNIDIVESAVFVEKITVTFRKSVESIIETGTLLIDAKSELPHGSFEKMIESELPFGPRTARHLMTIAEKPLLANRNHGSFLPASWRTLAELARVPDRLLEQAIDKGLVTADMTRKEAVALRARPHRPPRKKTVAEMKATPVSHKEVKRKLTQLSKLAARARMNTGSRFRAGVFRQIEQDLRELRERIPAYEVNAPVSKLVCQDEVDIDDAEVVE